jgi:hypothetical protein
MSGTVPLTIGGAFNGHTGVVTVPSSLLFGALSTSGSVNSLLQAYLGGITNAVTVGGMAFENQDIAAGLHTVVAGTLGGGQFEEFTNVNPAGGASAAGSVNYPGLSVTGGTTDLVVMAPGNETLTGVGSTTKAMFGAGSNVNYSVLSAAPGVIDLLGGANSVSLYDTTVPNAETIYSAGADTVNLLGQGTDYVTVLGNGVVQVQDANAYVTAEGNATTNLFWDNANSGGQLHFTNNSSVAATIHIGVFGTVGASSHVTAYGGAGGGFYVGGSAGNNSLVGGTGVVTLVGAGPGDFLEANSSIGTNVLAAGPGNSTMVASSTTGSNIFGAGLQYPGLGNPAADGVISTSGSGVQTFFLGNVPGGESVFGSTASTAVNNYFIVSGPVDGATVGGGLYSIYNFINSASTIFLSNGVGGRGTATISSAYVDQGHHNQYDINLSDGTTIMLKGLTANEIANIHTTTLFGIDAIVG